MRNTQPTSNTKDIKSNVHITKRTIDNITYTIKSRSIDSATQTLKDKLEAIISRDIAKLT
jgi:hypothetical protein